MIKQKLYRIFTDGNLWYCQELRSGHVIFRSNTKLKCENFIQSYIINN